ncbi:MAG: hypothetical protein WD397_08500 [Wenzhouxiangellaceae bacterium]
MLKEALYRYWFPKILERRCPSVISRSGEKGEEVNCFSVAIDKGDDPYLLVEAYDDGDITASEWDGKKYSKRTRIPVEDVLYGDLRITHFYGLAEIIYSSIYDFTFHRVTGLEYIKIHAHWSSRKLGQFAFSYKRLLTRKRMKLLRLLIEDHLDRRHKGIDSMELMTKLYSIKWVLHPRSSYQHEKVKLYLDSLAETGDVRKVNSTYIVTGKAISTLERFEEEEKRHRQSTWLQALIVILTLLIALFAMLQTELIRVPTLLNLATVPEVVQQSNDNGLNTDAVNARAA